MRREETLCCSAVTGVKGWGRAEYVHTDVPWSVRLRYRYTVYFSVRVVYGLVNLTTSRRWPRVVCRCLDGAGAWAPVRSWGQATAPAPKPTEWWWWWWWRRRERWRWRQWRWSSSSFIVSMFRGCRYRRRRRQQETTTREVFYLAMPKRTRKEADATPLRAAS